MNDKPIKKDIKSYLAIAKQLEEKRSRIEDFLTRTAIPNMISLVSPHLPQGYQIDPQESKVCFSYPQHVPMDISVSLRLKYKGKQLDQTNQSHMELISTARKSLEPLLNELSNSYGVHIAIFGKPIRI